MIHEGACRNPQDSLDLLFKFFFSIFQIIPIPRNFRDYVFNLTQNDGKLGSWENYHWLRGSEARKKRLRTATKCSAFALLSLMMYQSKGNGKAIFPSGSICPNFQDMNHFSCSTVQPSISVRHVTCINMYTKICLPTN